MVWFKLTIQKFDNGIEMKELINEFVKLRDLTIDYENNYIYIFNLIVKNGSIVYTIKWG